MNSGNEAHLQAFKEFLGKLRTLSFESGNQADLGKFRDFLKHAQTAIGRSLSGPLERLRQATSPLTCLLDHQSVDLLEIAGIQGSEDRYTNLIAWMLSPETHDKFAEQLQYQWLRGIGIPELQEGSVGQVMTQVVTNDGIPDLILRFPNRVVIVEAKTGSEEHPTPSGAMQTVAYPSAVRRLWSLPMDHPIDVVFLTLNRARPANAEAFATSYMDFCMVAAGVLQQVDVPTPIHQACDLILQHFLQYATPLDVDVRLTLKVLYENNWEIGPQTMACIDDVAAVVKLSGKRA